MDIAGVVEVDLELTSVSQLLFGPSIKPPGFIQKYTTEDCMSNCERILHNPIHLVSAGIRELKPGLVSARIHKS